MEETRRKKRAPQLTLVLRVGGGAYLLYLAWGLGRAALSGERSLLFGAAALLFALAGAALCAVSAQALARGDFLRPGECGEDGDAEKEAAEHEQD